MKRKQVWDQGGYHNGKTEIWPRLDGGGVVVVEVRRREWIRVHCECSIEGPEEDERKRPRNIPRFLA